MQKVIATILIGVFRQFYTQILSSKWGKFWLIGGAILYLISPIDIIPELFLPIIGYFDDGTILWLIISSILSFKPPIKIPKAGSRTIDSN